MSNNWHDPDDPAFSFFLDEFIYNDEEKKRRQPHDNDDRQEQVERKGNQPPAFDDDNDDEPTNKNSGTRFDDNDPDDDELDDDFDDDPDHDDEPGSPVNMINRNPVESSCPTVADIVAQPLFLAIANGQFDEVLVLLRDNPNWVNAKGARGLTLLHYAVAVENLAIVQFLVNCGADVHAKNDADCTSLDVAKTRGNAEVIECLENTCASQALFDAIKNEKLDEVRTLLENNPQWITAKDKKGLTSLHYAAECGGVELVQLLVSKGANADTTDNDGDTPLDLARKNGNDDVAHYLGSWTTKLERMKNAGATASAQSDPGDKLDDTYKPDIKIKRNSVQSSSIASVGYAEGILEVEFLNGSVYRYHNVPMETYVGLMNDDSHGSYLNSNVKIQGYRYEKIEEGTHAEQSQESMPVIDNTVEAPQPSFEELYGYDANAAGKNGSTILHKAVARGNIAIVKLLISKGANVNANGAIGTPLHEVCSVDVAEYLVSEGADVNAKNNAGNTPLDIAKIRGNTEVIEYLASVGATASAVNEPDDEQICFTAEEQAVIDQFCAKHGSDVNAVCKHGKTLLHKAAELGKIEVVKYLVSQGADVDAKTHAENTPLHFAVKKEHIEIAQYLVNYGAYVGARNNAGDTPIDIAQTRGNAAMIECLRYQYYYIGVLYYEGNGVVKDIKKAVEWWEPAAELGDPHSQFLLGFCHLNEMDGIDWDKREAKRWLHAAAKQGYEPALKIFCLAHPLHPLHIAVMSNDTETLENLVRQGADLEMKEGTGKTPLMCAAIFNSWKSCRLLLDAGADVHACDNKKRTAFHLAIWDCMYDWNKQICEMLLSTGADINALDCDNKTPLHWVAQHRPIGALEFLLQHGARTDLKDNQGNLPIDVTNSEWDKRFLREGKVGIQIPSVPSPRPRSNPPVMRAQKNIDPAEFLISNRADVNARDWGGETPLHEAVELGEIEIVKSLISKGADASARNQDGETPLHLALSALDEKYFEDDEYFDLAKFLVANGADVNATDDKGNTLLHWAAESGSVTITSFLVDNGAKLNERNSKGMTPLSVATGKAVKFLYKIGAIT